MILIPISFHFHFSFSIALPIAVPSAIYSNAKSCVLPYRRTVPTCWFYLDNHCSYTISIRIKLPPSLTEGTVIKAYLLHTIIFCFHQIKQDSKPTLICFVNIDQVTHNIHLYTCIYIYHLYDYLSQVTSVTIKSNKTFT